MTNQVFTLQVADVAATNLMTSAVSTNALSRQTTANENPQGGVHRGRLSSVAILALVAVGLVVLAARKLRASSKAFEQGVKDALLDDVIDAVAKDALNQAELRAELAGAIAGTGTLSGPLASILRIEESYSKNAKGKYLRRVSILKRKDGATGSLVKVESEVGSEYVPDAVRAKFIETRGDKVVRLVYDAQGKDEA